jgi:hypothetical protein
MTNANWIRILGSFRTNFVISHCLEIMLLSDCNITGQEYWAVSGKTTFFGCVYIFSTCGSRRQTYCGSCGFGFRTQIISPRPTSRGNRKFYRKKFAVDLLIGGVDHCSIYYKLLPRGTAAIAAEGFSPGKLQMSLKIQSRQIFNFILGYVKFNQYRYLLSPRSYILFLFFIYCAVPVIIHICFKTAFVKKLFVLIMLVLQKAAGVIKLKSSWLKRFDETLMPSGKGFQKPLMVT